MVYKGVGRVVIIGPPGLQGLIEQMAPFTNRRYPNLIVKEIAEEGSSINFSKDGDILSQLIEVDSYVQVTAYPVFMRPPSEKEVTVP